jgi:hypothetical protein
MSAAPMDWPGVFGRQAPRILEIGFGMGGATAEIARGHPENDYLGVEVHTPGVGALLKRIGELDLANLRIVQHDAVEVLQHMLAESSLDGIHIFFPDPWHKKRHHKRRLIQPAFVELLASRLGPAATCTWPRTGRTTPVRCWKSWPPIPFCATRRTAMRPGPTTAPSPSSSSAACAWAMGSGIWFSAAADATFTASSPHPPTADALPGVSTV